MNLQPNKNGRLPWLLNDFFGTLSLVGKDMFDLDFIPSRLGINVPTANIAETPTAYNVSLLHPALNVKISMFSWKIVR